ncbi:hypothetical protein [Paenibacillus gallinarum]|uniref:Uncharacterized protein n=1 Tax=Paenibacillus gallinarum TaxID=2762232 RepID=A0ABR8T4C0_9BACL|nr:hypothetical protein [Paenibacillus gallinarum]MBD7970598.1 hypothetical protein [Paenibacillus gallinarum]
MDNKPRTSEADFAYDRYKTLNQESENIDMIPEDDLDYVNTYTKQTISLDEDTEPVDAETAQEGVMQDLRPVSLADDTEEEDFNIPNEELLRSSEPDLAAVPDADEIAKDSPIDPVSPDPDAMHGTDLINGVGNPDQK